jgi:cytochrome d ubiquinol oxidase subunit I
VSTVLVALGSIFSSVWIIVANSWQQTPAGYRIVGEGAGRRAEVVDFWAVVFNPSTLHRLVHTLLGAEILGAFFMMSVSAYYLLRGRHGEFARRSFRIALVVGTIASVAALFPSGHMQAAAVARNQPAKLAAMEAHFETGTSGSPLWLFGIPDAEARRVHFGLAVPNGLSLLVHEDASTPVTGLDRVPARDWPPVGPTFQAYHLMVALGMGFIALTLFASYRWWRGRLFASRALLRVFVFAVIGPLVANQAGWVAAELGRQPWVVYGLLRTGDAASKSVTAGQVTTSIAMFGAIYVMLLLVWLYVLDDKIRHGPDDAVGEGGGEAILEAAGSARGLESLTATGPSAPGKDG